MKKNKKNNIDIEAEFVGLPMSQKTEKEKKNDLTKDLKNFIDNPINIDCIKNILLRIHGRYILENHEISTMKIYGLEKKSEFFIIINHSKYFSLKYYLTKSCFYLINRMKDKSIYTSYLKEEVGGIIYNWLQENTKYIKIIE